jgi:hypothetical protein
MSTIADIEAAGLGDDLEVLFAEFFKKDDAKAKKSLTSVIDKHGLQSPEVIREVGALQRAETLEPGIYKRFKDLNTKLAGGGNGETKEVKSMPVDKPMEEPKEEPKVEAKVDTGESDVILTASDEEEIREKIRKEEKAWREKMAKRELKLREQKIKKNKKSAQRLGLKAEEAAAIKDKKDKIAIIQAENKELKAKVKGNNEAVKALREEINQIRPKKAKPNTNGPKNRPATKVDAKELDAAVSVITEYLKDNPGSKSSAIKENTGVDGGLYNAAISSMKDAGKVEQKGRGPFTNYTLC